MRRTRGSFATYMAVTGCLAVALTGCQDSGSAVSSSTSPAQATSAGARGPDISANGQVDYACALARHVARDPGTFTSSNFTIGDDADPSEYEIGGAVSLLGAPVAGELSGFEDLSKAASDTFGGITRLDLKELNAGVKDLSRRCVKHQLPAGDPDISGSGRVTYACALVTDLKEHRDPVSSWTLKTGGEADKAEYAAGGAAGLLGATTGSHVAGHRAMSDAATQIYDGLSRLDAGPTQKGIDAFAKSCRSV